MGACDVERRVRQRRGAWQRELQSGKRQQNGADDAAARFHGRGGGTMVAGVWYSTSIVRRSSVLGNGTGKKAFMMSDE